ncbi:hypothetical protein QCN27_03980 [Cereibacter sp. SYSU M97828]|nr:hypothetical protein [Cereibacter flavus]
MIGTVALVVRFILFPLLGALAAAGIGVIDDANGTFTIHIENAVQVISAAVLYGLTIVWSRIAKKRGGKT